MNEIVNCRIKSTTLGYEDHGILTFYLHLEGDGWGQGYGGYVLGSEFTTRVIKGVLDTVGVSKWEDLPFKYVRVDKEPWGKIFRLGNIVEDKWLDLDALAKELKTIKETTHDPV